MWSGLVCSVCSFQCSDCSRNTLLPEYSFHSSLVIGLLVMAGPPPRRNEMRSNSMRETTSTIISVDVKFSGIGEGDEDEHIEKQPPLTASPAHPAQPSKVILTQKKINYI